MIDINIKKIAFMNAFRDVQIKAWQRFNQLYGVPIRVLRPLRFSGNAHDRRKQRRAAARAVKR